MKSANRPQSRLNRCESDTNGYSPDGRRRNILYEKHKNLPKEQKIEWLDKFYRRMSNALYKWSIMPPSIIVDSRSINKYDYKQPITSSKINYKGISEKEISKKLKEFLLCQT